MTEVLKGELAFPYVGKVVFGPGTAVERLSSELTTLGARSAMVVTGKTLAYKTELVDRIKSALGRSCAGVFADTYQHVPRETVLQGAKMAQDLAADALVVLGGSTASDTARGIALVLAEGPRFEDHELRFEPPGKWIVPVLSRPKLPVIAIPTTLSGGEFTHALAIKNTATRTKGVFMDPKLASRVVILDPEMTVATGKELWVSTCLKVLCDCIEIVCSLEHQPYSDALCLAGIETIFRYLPGSVSEPLDFEARGQLQHTTMMTMSVFMSVGLGLVAGIRHVLGGVTEVNHGIPSSIMVPYVMEFNRPNVSDRLALIASAAGVDVSGLSADAAAAAAIAAVRDLSRRMGVPARLRDVGVRQEDFDTLGEQTVADPSARTNPRPFTRKDVAELLARAY